jgi:ketosteroid isomerase-like protein
MNSAEKIEMGRKFHPALLSRDWSAIRSLLADNATWTLPGNNLISGTAVGAGKVTARAEDCGIWRKFYAQPYSRQP